MGSWRHCSCPARTGILTDKEKSRKIASTILLTAWGDMMQDKEIFIFKAIRQAGTQQTSYFALG